MRKLLSVFCATVFLISSFNTVFADESDNLPQYFFDSQNGRIEYENQSGEMITAYEAEQMYIYNYRETDESILFIENGTVKQLNKPKNNVEDLKIDCTVSEFEMSSLCGLVYISDRDTGYFSNEGSSVFEKDLYTYNFNSGVSTKIAENIKAFEIYNDIIYYLDQAENLHTVLEDDTLLDKSEYETKLNILNDENFDIALFAATADDIVSIAEGELGYKESGTNNTKYGAWYGINPGAWCAMFVSWCANQAGIGTNIIPKFADCDVGKNWFINGADTLFETGRYYGGRNYQPQKGDIIFFSSKKSMSDSTHVGIVTGSDSNNVYTIEGNTSDMVARRSYTLGNSTILGYGVPKYETYHNPEGCIDICDGGAGTVHVRGWAFDRDDVSQSIPVHIYIGGGPGSSNSEGYPITANSYRDDVNNVYGVGSYHGYDAVIPTSKTGTQSVYIYACNIGGGTNILLGEEIVTIKPADTEPPVISNIKITDISSKGYTVSCTVTDNKGISSVKFPTWTDNNGQDDLIWYEGVISGNTASCRISTSNHNNEYGNYMTHIYADDIFGNVAAKTTSDIGLIEVPQYDSYTVTFNANGGTTPTETKSVTYNSTYGTLPTPTRTGYTFKGWYTSTSGGTQITSSTNVTLTANQTLYAQWTANTYNITFNANGGATPPETKSVTYDSTYGTLPTPTRTGYIFDGWYTEENGGTKITSDTKVTVTAEQTLYAQWAEPISITESVYTDNTISVKAALADELANQKGTAIIALYNRDILVTMYRTEAAETIEYIFENISENDSNYSIKIFCWCDLKTLLPLCNSASAAVQ